MLEVVYINGDGIGIEVMDATRRVMDAVMGGEIHWIEALAGLDCYKECGDPLPMRTLNLLRLHKLGIKGPTTTPGGGGFRSVNVQLREKLDLYVGLRPAFSLPIPKSNPEVNIAIFRENTEGLYACEEIVSEDGKSVELRAHFNYDAFLRLARAAFAYARAHSMPLTYVDKQNIHKAWGHLYNTALNEVAKDYPDVTYWHRLVDATNMELILRTKMFGVICTENMFGDILADNCAALMGGLGVAPGANIGDEIALFEAVHGSWPEGAGKGIANPTALMLSGCMLLEHAGHADEGRTLRTAIKEALQRNPTTDLGGSLNTVQFTESVLERLTASMS